MAARGVGEFDPDRLRAAMGRAGLSVGRLAAAAGLDRQSASAILNGRRVPTASTVGRLAAAAGVAPAELLAEGGDDIRALRLAAGLTQRQAADLTQRLAADRSGLTRSSWAMHETGKVASLDGEQAELIAAALGTDVQTVAAAHARTRSTQLNKEKNP